MKINKKIKKTLFAGLLMVAVATSLSGCQSFSFYGQAIKGQYQILAHQESINKKIARPDTDPKLKIKFQQVLDFREFAENELKLPVGSHYLKYVDLHRKYVVWSVSAAPELSLEPKAWWYPIVGCASYRGYFSEEAAHRYAEKLKEEGLDVYVAGISTYSTLGWFSDPLLNTFIHEPESDLAETIFHELAHQRLFVAGDTDFNEAFATAVAEEGVRRWFEKRHNPDAWKKYQLEMDQHRQFLHLVLSAVEKLKTLYADPTLSDAKKRARKEEIIAQLRLGHQKLKEQWGGQSPYDHWFEGPINNAKLGTVATYYDLVPAFEAVLRSKGGDMEKFYKAVEELSKLDKENRHQALQKYLQKST